MTHQEYYKRICRTIDERLVPDRFCSLDSSDEPGFTCMNLHVRFANSTFDALAAVAYDRVAEWIDHWSKRSEDGCYSIVRSRGPIVVKTTYDYFEHRLIRDDYRDRAKAFAEDKGGPSNIDDWDDDQWMLFELANDPVVP